MESRRVRWVRRTLNIAGPLCALCIVASSAHAANACPWLNEATASGLLGIQATGAYQSAATGQPAVCTFTGQNDVITRVLQIQVITVPDAEAHLKVLKKSCTSETIPLQAIGNEAVSCISDDRSGRLGARIVGRVRDQVFTIRISSSQKHDSVLTRSAIQRIINTAAEQVAGNLF